MFRYRHSLWIWIWPLLAVSFFLLGTIYAVIRNVCSASGWSWSELTKVLLPDLAFTVGYALVTAALQVLIGSAIAVAFTYTWGKAFDWNQNIPRWIYLFLIPYFAPVMVFSEALHQYAVMHGVNLEGPWGYVGLTCLSVWEFFPFVFILIVEELRDIPTNSWKQLHIEGGSIAEAIPALIAPKISTLLPQIALLRFLWMYTKVDVMWFLFHSNSVIAGRFLHFDLFRRLYYRDDKDPLVNREALLMILGAVIIIAVSLAVTFVWRKWLSRYFAPFWSSLLVLWVWRSTDRVAARLSPLFAAGGLASLLLAVTVLPALVATYYGFFSNNLLGPVLRSELINEWRDAIHGRNLDLTWCWHTLLLASAASLCYTLLSFILAHALVRESRLSMIKPFFVTNILPVCAYVVPIIAIAYPIGSLMRGMDASTEPGIIFKLAILHGFYLWPLTLTLAYGSIRKADPRPELSALIERGRFADVVRMVSIPTLKRRMIAVGLIAFAISYNELIFGVYVIQDKKFYTLPVGIAMKLVSQGDDGSPAVILVLTALTSIIAVAFATAMAFISNVHKEE